MTAGCFQQQRFAVLRIRPLETAGGPKVSITSYPGARIFVSTTESTGNGDPAVNSQFKLIGVTDSKGKLQYNGGNTYALPAGARFLGFSADVVDIDMAEVENHPMITSLSENTQPQVREAMVQQVITQMAKAKGLKPEKKTGYMVLESGKMSYDLR